MLLISEANFIEKILYPDYDINLHEYGKVILYIIFG